MGDEIEFDPTIAHAISNYLTTGYDSASELLSTLDSCIEKLASGWHDKSAADVIELLRTYKTMYKNVIEAIPKVQERLKETERLYLRQEAQKALAQAQQQQAIRDKYPNYDSLPKIGPDRRRW